LVDNLKLLLLSNLQATTCRTHAVTLAIPSHNSKNARITLHPKPQLQEYSSIWPLRYCPKSHIPSISKASQTQCLLHQKSPGAPHESQGAKGFRTAWRGTRIARREAPLMLLFLQVLPCGTTLIAKRHTLQFSTGFIAIAWRSNTRTK